MILALAVSVADWMERQVSISVAMTSRNASSVRVLPFLRMEYRQARLHRFMFSPPHFLCVKPVGSLVCLLYSCLPGAIGTSRKYSRLPRTPSWYTTKVEYRWS